LAIDSIVQGTISVHIATSENGQVYNTAESSSTRSVTIYTDTTAQDMANMNINIPNAPIDINEADPEINIDYTWNPGTLFDANGQAGLDYQTSFDNGNTWSNYENEAEGGTHFVLPVQIGQLIPVLVRTKDKHGNVSSVKKLNVDIFTVNYALNGGSMTQPNQEYVNSGQKVFTPNDIPTKSSISGGIEFSRWCSDGTYCQGDMTASKAGMYKYNTNPNNDETPEVNIPIIPTLYNVNADPDDGTGNLLFTANYRYVKPTVSVDVADLSLTNFDSSGKYAVAVYPNLPSCDNDTVDIDGTGATAIKPAWLTGVSKINVVKCANGVQGDLNYIGQSYTQTLSITSVEHTVTINPNSQLTTKVATQSILDGHGLTEVTASNYQIAGYTLQGFYANSNGIGSADNQIPDKNLRPTASSCGTGSVLYLNADGQPVGKDGEVEPSDAATDETDMGIKSDLTIYACYLDITAPAVSLNSASADTILDGSATSFNIKKINASDSAIYANSRPDATKLQYQYACDNNSTNDPDKINFSDWKTNVTSYSCNFTPGTPVYVHARAKDPANNISVVSSKKFVFYKVSFNVAASENLNHISIPSAKILSTYASETAPGALKRANGQFLGWCGNRTGAANEGGTDVCKYHVNAGGQIMNLTSNVVFTPDWRYHYQTATGLNCGGDKTVYSNDSAAKKKTTISCTVSPFDASNPKVTVSISSAAKEFASVSAPVLSGTTSKINYTGFRTGVVKVVVTSVDNKKLSKTIYVYNKLLKNVKGFPLKDAGSGQVKSAIKWVYGVGITTGLTKTQYAGANGVRRDQMAMFMWRMASKPTPTLKKNPFKDVSNSKSNAFKPPILWLVQENITTGMTKNTYAGGSGVTRAQMAMFLYRFVTGEKTPTKTYKWKFKDIKSMNKDFKNAINWMASTGVTTGTTPTTYAPSAPVRRDQMALFMQRFYNNVLLSKTYAK
jgi:hypothetical protein